MITERYLVVDLDGSLLRSDMLFESFWSATAGNWAIPFRAAQALLKGRAALKSRLSEHSRLDVRTLPYNGDVIAYIENWRAEGGRTALVTASNDGLAQQVAAHLGLFDEVYGSDAEVNLKGATKAAFLQDRYGAAGFDYIGDARADMPVWALSSKAILVNVSAGLRTQVQRLGRDICDLPGQTRLLRSLLQALRPHQWLKNLLIFLPMLAAHRMDLVTFGQSLLAFLAFCLMASSAYLLNDMLDLAADRAHPRKRNRPFASGAVPLSYGTVLAPLLALTGLALGLGLGPEFAGVLGTYYAATLAYSLYFKRQLIIDICLLAGLYALRIIAGGAATGIELSFWLISFALALFFSLAAVKRQAELVDAAQRAAEQLSGRGYRVADLPLVMAMATAAGYLAVLILAVYITSEDVLALYASPALLWGACLILFYWVNRMVMLTHRGQMHDDPVVFAVKDRVSLLCLGLVGLLGIGASL